MDNRTEHNEKDILTVKSKKSIALIPEADFSFHKDAEPNLEQFKDELGFMLNGLEVHVGKVKPYIFHLAENREVSIPDNTFLARIDFRPDKKEEYASENLSTALASLITGMQKFFDLYPNDEEGVWGKPVPSYFYGFTNKRMAKFVTNFGFEMNYQPQNDTYLVLGEYKNVKGQVKRFTEEKPEFINSIIERAIREQAVK